jgi:trigger factor
VHSSDYKFAIDSHSVLLKEVQFDLPEAFLKRWIKATNKKITDEQIDADFDHYMADLKWQLIKDKIAKDNQLEITEEDIRVLAKEMAFMQFRQYGLNNISDEHLDNYADHMLKNEEDRRKLEARKEENLIVATIKSKVALDLKEISFDEFNKMLEN